MNDEPSPPRAPESGEVAARGAAPPRPGGDDARRPAPAREITLAGLALTLRRGLWLLLAVIALAVLAAAVLLKARAPAYTATMVVAPAERDLGAASRLATEIEQYANLATLAQTPDKLEQTAPIERYVELLGSVPVAERLDAEHGLLRRVYEDSWDAAAERWRPPEGLLAGIRRAIQGFFGYPGWTPPSALALADYLETRIQITRVAQSALRLLRIEHPDGAFAAELLGLVHAAADDLLREAALARVRAQIVHLETELGAARPERRAALEATLTEQYQAEALLASETPFAAEIVRPPTPSPAPTSASPLLVLALAAVVGVIIGVFLVFLRDALRSA